MTRCLLAFLTLLLGAISIAEAQPRGRPRPQFIDPDQLNQAEGVRVLNAFRTARLAGDYAFIFNLRQFPRRGKETVTSGTMWGTWRSDGRALTRVHIAEENRELRYLQIGGQPGAVFRKEGQNPSELLAGDQKFQPVVEGSTFSSFELQMPFLFWEDYIYEGTRKFRGRPTHYFILYPPQDFQMTEVGAVRVLIDAEFNAMLRAEILDADGLPLKTFKITSFKKVGGQWIIKAIDLLDEKTRDKTRFEVTGAAVGLQLPEDVFDPATLNDQIDPVPWQDFERL